MDLVEIRNVDKCYWIQFDSNRANHDLVNVGGYKDLNFWAKRAKTRAKRAKNASEASVFKIARALRDPSHWKELAESWSGKKKFWKSDHREQSYSLSKFRKPSQASQAGTKKTSKSDIASRVGVFFFLLGRGRHKIQKFWKAVTFDTFEISFQTQSQKRSASVSW